jgi:rubrerythrin
MGIEHAIEMALEGERRGLAYYEHIAGSTSSERVRSVAEEFAAEEREHVAELERVLEAHRRKSR